MKKIKWLNPNKMEFNSLHKTFNRQCKLISRGAQIGDVVVSSFVRPRKRIESHGQKFPEGYLQEYDLNWLELPESIRRWIRANAIEKGVWAYVFFHRVNGKKIIDGFVINDENHKNLLTIYARNNAKTRSIIDEAKKYICN